MTTRANDLKSSRTSLEVWRAFSFRLGAIAILSICVAALLVPYASTPDGRDPFYVGVAWQFVVWGAIDLWFAVSGLRESTAIRRLADFERQQRSTSKAHDILRILRASRWQNIVWLTLGALTLAAGYAFHSASVAGHGVGVILQATLLVLFDQSFAAALARSLGSNPLAAATADANSNAV